MGLLKVILKCFLISTISKKIITIEIPLYFKEFLSVGFYHSEISQTQDTSYFLYKNIFLVEKCLHNINFSDISKVLNRYMI